MSTRVKIRRVRFNKSTPSIKQKTNKSYAKRFDVNSNGKIFSSQANKRHNMSSKSSRVLFSQTGKSEVNKSNISFVRSALSLSLPKSYKNNSSKVVFSGSIISKKILKVVKKISSS